MDLQSVGAVGELVGAVGVIASLLYLATQIRQAQAVARAESIRQIHAAFFRYTDALVADREVALLWRRGLNDRSLLEEVDQTRLDAMIGDLVLTFIDLRYAFLNGLVEVERYEPWRSWVAMILNTPGGSEYWS